MHVYVLGTTPHQFVILTTPPSTHVSHPICPAPTCSWITSPLVLVTAWPSRDTTPSLVLPSAGQLRCEYLHHLCKGGSHHVVTSLFHLLASCLHCSLTLYITIAVLAMCIVSMMSNTCNTELGNGVYKLDVSRSKPRIKLIAILLMLNVSRVDESKLICNWFIACDSTS